MLSLADAIISAAAFHTSIGGEKKIWGQFNWNSPISPQNCAFKAVGLTSHGRLPTSNSSQGKIILIQVVNYTYNIEVKRDHKESVAPNEDKIGDGNHLAGRQFNLLALQLSAVIT